MRVSVASGKQGCKTRSLPMRRQPHKIAIVYSSQPIKVKSCLAWIWLLA